MAFRIPASVNRAMPARMQAVVTRFVASKPFESLKANLNRLADTLFARVRQSGGSASIRRPLLAPPVPPRPLSSHALLPEPSPSFSFKTHNTGSDLLSDEPDTPNNLSAAAPEACNRQQVVLPANPAAGNSGTPKDTSPPGFPFVVHYDFADVTAGLESGTGIQNTSVQLALEDSIWSRQGVFEWVGEGEVPLQQQLLDLLEQNDTVTLPSGLMVHGMENIMDGPDMACWNLLVTAPAHDLDDQLDTFSVPWTACKFASPAEPGQPEHLAMSELALAQHQELIDPAYRDSVFNPLMLSNGCKQLARQHALNLEVDSLAKHGLMGNHVAANRQPAAAGSTCVGDSLSDTLGQLAGQFMADSCNIQASPVLEHAQRKFSDARLAELSVSPQPHSAFVGRHLPAREQALVEETNGPALALPPQAECRTLSLAGKAPQCQPHGGAAYAQTQLANHCGMAAINAFFQSNVVNSAQLVNALLDQYEQVLGNLQNLKLPGLYHPTVVEAMRNSEAVSMSRDDFLKVPGGNSYEAYSQTYLDSPEQQWDALACGLTGGGLTPVSVQVSPDRWLSLGQHGLNLDNVVAIVNSLLLTAQGDPNWSSYPSRVDNKSVADLQASGQLAWLEERLVQNAQSRNGSQNSPMICMTPGHYFAVFRGDTGDWFRQDSLYAPHDGIQPPLPFAKRGELEQALKRTGVVHVVCEKSWFD